MFRPNLESGLDAQVHDRMQELQPDLGAIRIAGRSRRRPAGPVRRARRSVGRALVALGTQVAGAQGESMSGGQQAA